MNHTHTYTLEDIRKYSLATAGLILIVPLNYVQWPPDSTIGYVLKALSVIPAVKLFLYFFLITRPLIVEFSESECFDRDDCILVIGIIFFLIVLLGPVVASWLYPNISSIGWFGLWLCYMFPRSGR